MAYVAKHNYAPVSASKARLVIDLVRGKPVDEALSLLKFQPQRSARMIEKVIASAAANATNLGEEGELFVSKAWVDQSFFIARFRPRAKGRMFKVRHRRCHICVEVDS